MFIIVVLLKKFIYDLGGKVVVFESDYGFGVVKDSINFYVNILLDFSKESNLIDLYLINFEENIFFVF